MAGLAATVEIDGTVAGPSGWVVRPSVRQEEGTGEGDAGEASNGQRMKHERELLTLVSRPEARHFLTHNGPTELDSQVGSISETPSKTRGPPGQALVSLRSRSAGPDEERCRRRRRGSLEATSGSRRRPTTGRHRSRSGRAGRPSRSGLRATLPRAPGRSTPRMCCRTSRCW
jgi:hypothetical protein